MSTISMDTMENPIVTSIDMKIHDTGIRTTRTSIIVIGMNV